MTEPTIAAAAPAAAPAPAPAAAAPAPTPAPTPAAPSGAVSTQPTGFVAPSSPAAPAAPVDGAPAAPAAAPAPAGTLASGTAPEAPAPVAADWPADWRAKLAGDDKAYLKTLERYASPADMSKALREAQKKISSGDIGKKAPAADAPAEEVAAWRKENGIPDDPKGYDTDLGNGLVWGEADKPFLDDFTAFAHGKNLPPAQVKDMLGWYAKTQEQAAAQMQQADGTFHLESDQALRKEWGADFKRNINAIGNLLGTVDGGAEWILQARSQDGKLLGDDPRFVKWLASTAIEVNPVATLLPAGAADPAKSIADRKSDIEKMMGDKGSDYWRGPKSDGIQKEYRELIEASEKLRSRQAA